MFISLVTFSVHCGYFDVFGYYWQVSASGNDTKDCGMVPCKTLSASNITSTVNANAVFQIGILDKTSISYSMGISQNASARQFFKTPVSSTVPADIFVNTSGVFSVGGHVQFSKINFVFPTGGSAGSYAILGNYDKAIINITQSGSVSIINSQFENITRMLVVSSNGGIIQAEIGGSYGYLEINNTNFINCKDDLSKAPRGGALSLIVNYS
ncbi:MAG: hypothetical protein EZS28_045569, partial [Streblomastix strix]